MGMNAKDLINYAKSMVKYDVEKYDKIPATQMGDERREKAHRFYTGKALFLLERVIDNGGTEDEVKRASEWLLVTIDAVKHHIDYVPARNKLGIRELETKFPPKK